MFSRMSFKVQLSVPFVTTVVGLIVIAGIFFFNSRIYNGSIDQMELFRAIDAKLVKIDRDLLSARRIETDYIHNRTPGLVEQRSELIVDAIGILDSLIAQISSEENKAKLEELKAQVMAYDENFVNLVKQVRVVGEDEKSGLQGLLRNSVHKVEELLKEYANDKITVTMLMMRRHEKDFLLRFDPKYIGRMEERHKEFKAQIEAANLPYDVGVVVQPRLKWFDL
ncbi:MAG: hypothetical protein JJ879_04185 [Sneathiella sp.]|nr:hypothetical protein [Sneathiella sp.]